jgi:hypothetical protein
VPGEYTAFLEDGEQVDHVVKALAGPNRWLGLGGATLVGLGVALGLGNVLFGLIALYLVFTCLYVRHRILVTDRAVVLVSGNRISFKPKALVERLPADTPLRPLKGLWLQLQLGGHRLYVSSRSIREVSAVEAERRDGKRP